MSIVCRGNDDSVTVPPLYFKTCKNMDDFDSFMVEVDSECVGQDFDNVDLYAENTIVEDEFYDDGGILYE